MATYNFKNDVKVYIVYNSYRYKLDVTEDLSFSQTFTDQTYPQRTLHNLNHVFDQSNIKKANPANFEFTIPALVENDLQIVQSLLIDYDSSGHSLKTFDMYIQSSDIIYRLQDCVITNGTYIIEKLENLKLSIQGQAAKLSRDTLIPENYHGVTPQSRSGTRTFQRIEHLTASIGGTSILEGLHNVSIEVQNDIKWNPYETINDALLTNNASTSMYPSNFTLEKRIVSGSFSRYITDENKTDVQTWKHDQAIVIKAGKTETSGYQFNLDQCTFTNRSSVEDAFSQKYDWRLNSNPNDLGTLIKFNNI